MNVKVVSAKAAAKLLRWRVRTWCMLIWSAAIGYFAASILSSSSSDFMDDAFNDAFLVTLIVFVWPVGLVFIKIFALATTALVGWLREASERRRYWAELKAREAERKCLGD